MFSEALFEPERSLGRKAAAWPMAFLAHAAIAVLLVTIPLMRSPRLPAVDLTDVLVAPPPPAILSVPPKGKGGGSAKGKRIEAMRPARLVSPGLLVVPTDIPREITAEPLTDFGTWWGVDGGVPDGIDEPRLGVFPDWMFVPPAVDDAPVRAAGEVTPPRLVRRVDPAYPEIARKARVAGIVVLEATTDVAGRVMEVTVLRSIPLLDQAAIDAVKQWIYEPMVVNGRPRPVTFTVTVRFELK